MQRRGPPAMEKQYGLLERKLDELESNIRELYSQAAGEDDLPVPDGLSPGRRFVAVADVRKQVAFLSTLLAAEKECHSGNAPRHLRHISERFDGLRGAFRAWEDSPVPPAAYLDDDLWTCPCNHECFRETQAAEDEHAPEPEPEPEVIVPVEDLAPQEVQDDGDDVVEEEEEEPPRPRSGGRCGFISVAVAVVAVVMGLVANFHWVDENVYLVPT